MKHIKLFEQFTNEAFQFNFDKQELKDAEKEIKSVTGLKSRSGNYANPSAVFGSYHNIDLYASFVKMANDVDTEEYQLRVDTIHVASLMNRFFMFGAEKDNLKALRAWGRKWDIDLKRGKADFLKVDGILLVKDVVKCLTELSEILANNQSPTLFDDSTLDLYLV